MNVNQAALNHGKESRKTVQAVRVDAVAVGFGEKLGTAAGSLGLKPKLQENAHESVEKILIGDSKHELFPRLIPAKAGIVRRLVRRKT